ncbi:MAG: hypothetical protein GVY23_06810 [Spirochaetes bacterium]|jgi:endonuclease/exonuclease/phosphatase family metal-dependent hydrolase|nr:hypothetical protein [Spirochaetota bacterium]
MGYARVRYGPWPRALLALAAATAILPGCDAGGWASGSQAGRRAGPRAATRNAEHITILSYNVQNLFDVTDDGSEYAEFDPSAGVWTAEAADAKASNIARVIRRAARGGPDVLCLQEVEHGRVIADLARNHLGRQAYRYAAVSETPGSAVEVALLSRLPIEEARVHAPVRGWPQHHSRGRSRGTTLRPVLEVRLETAGPPLHLFVNHWKSKSGGARETEPARRAAARVVARRIGTLVADAPRAEIVVCGDLNESPSAFDEAAGAYPTALMPPDPRHAPHALRVSGDRAAVQRAAAAAGASAAGGEGEISAAVLYSPWDEAQAPGSYYFRGSWRRLDHTLVSPGLLDTEGWELAAFEVVAPPFATTADGRPLASRRPAPAGRSSHISGSGRAERGGFSDHLPVLLTLRRRAE